MPVPEQPAIRLDTPRGPLVRKPRDTRRQKGPTPKTRGEAGRALSAVTEGVPFDAPPPEETIPRDRNERLNRAVNVSLASLALLATLPLLIIIAVLMKLTSRGPIVYTQARVGYDRRWRSSLALRERREDDLGGKIFTIYKLRTMRVDAERHSGAVWAQANDPRVTTLGRYLRKFRIDEVPQLWNVIIGDMNLVGPRPERPSIVARLREDIPEYGARHRVRPGLTGLAQVNQHYDSCLEDVRAKVRWDLAYIRRQSLLLDLRIMLKTVPSVLLRFPGQ
jgi:lipopolysaccharide/colanic/teichoic acid biosynthesis glycosyltransferase